MVPEASHDASERYDAPKCHPETRKAVLSNIMSWVNSDNEATRIMWLYGPAGAGKSAIAQTTAEECHNEGKLVASFFFSRFRAGRNNKDGLVATIAYQICVSVPAMKEHIIKNVEKNPNIFKTNIRVQMQELVIEPFKLVKSELVIIDGLDECQTRKDQVEIIEAIAKSLSLIDSASFLRFLLVSRPEVEIRCAFNMESIASSCTRLALDDTFDPDIDVELYLQSHFQALRCEHILGSYLPISWPRDEDIDFIVRKSSGQFIYASIVVHYVSDLRHDPRKRLDDTLLFLEKEY
ncbi:hypothetical protein BDQ17DRAFT_1388780 [Cyathus striatus]|nr:hypothetical protein BDQ17DRAFT_1388780 [Cyathus striatus]